MATKEPDRILALHQEIPDLNLDWIIGYPVWYCGWSWLIKQIVVGSTLNQKMVRDKLLKIWNFFLQLKHLWLYLGKYSQKGNAKFTVNKQIYLL
jgi:hypothetical protein